MYSIVTHHFSLVAAAQVAGAADKENRPSHLQFRSDIFLNPNQKKSFFFTYIYENMLPVIL